MADARVKPLRNWQALLMPENGRIARALPAHRRGDIAHIAPCLYQWKFRPCIADCRHEKRPRLIRHFRPRCLAFVIGQQGRGKVDRVHAGNIVKDAPQGRLTAPLCPECRPHLCHQIGSLQYGPPGHHIPRNRRRPFRRRSHAGGGFKEPRMCIIVVCALGKPNSGNLAFGEGEAFGYGK
jgi:hypothetical protein